MSEKRGPLIAAAASIAVCILAVFFFVLPKMNAVSVAQKSLDDVRGQESSLRAQLAVLKADELAAPAYRRQIRKVEQQLPPTIDLPGLINLLRTSADQSSVELFSVTPGVPVFSDIGYSTLSANITVTGTYFALAEFAFKMETFPRAAKVLSISLAPSTSSTSSVGQISMQIVVEFYTTDSSSGPGGQPGPTQPEAPVVVPAAIPSPSPGA